VLDFVALEMASRLVSEQFSEDRPAPGRPRGNRVGKPIRTRAARALRIIADALEAAPQRRTAN
jgi:hypothetical protein